jgi:hypothetical protein
MRKLLVLFVVAATIAIPLYFARDPKPTRGYRRMAIAMAVAIVVWGLLLRYVYFAVAD